MLWYLEGGEFERWSSHDNGASLDGISPFLKEAPENSLIPFTMWTYSNTAVYELGIRLSPHTESAG